MSFNCCFSHSIINGFIGQLSAVAATKIARQKASAPAKPLAPEPAPQDLATVVGEKEFDGHHDGNSTPFEDSAEDAAPITPPRRPAIQLSSFDRKKAVWAADFASDLELNLSANETATVVGEYDLSVLNGIVTVYGSALRPESGKKRIFAPSTQALPQIQARQDGTMIRIFQVKSSIRKLERLSPLFRNTWSDNKSSFKLSKSSDDDELQRSLSALEIDSGMDTVLRTLSARVMVEPRKPRILAIGAKSSGKSTFNRILCNHIQSWTPAARCQYLDLDPGQPEFGPPGQVSLVEVATPLLGSPFTHFAERDSSVLKIIRSHPIASTTFKHEPEHYRDCALDLIRRGDSDLPLIVNACGWVNGLGASVLTELVALLQITDLVLLEPLEADLVEQLKESSREITLHRMPRQPPRPSSRTPAEHRAIQSMAYFHHRQQDDAIPRFSGKLLSSARPYVVSYAGSDQSVLAIASYIQAPKPEFLSEVLDGSLVAIVVLEPGHAVSFEEIIGRTPDNIPYLLPNADGTTRTLDPRYSSSIGLTLIRGIDIETNCVQLVTPLSEAEMGGLADKDVVLVRGAFDPPEWAYLEDLYADNDYDADVDERPWVTKREMNGIEGAVWRMRHPPVPSSGLATPR